MNRKEYFKLILKTKDFQDVVKTILFAIDSKDVSLFTETLELKANGTNLDLNVTNREYFVTRKFTLDRAETFNAAVNARLFLNLISKLTTETIEIIQEDNNIKVKANGDYKLPMIYNNDKLLELPTIEINNVTNEMNINSTILHSITNYNSKELLRGVIVKPVQKYYYVDESGAITFTSGACVNNFSLEKPIKMLLTDKVVKLFKLFKPGEVVAFKIGQDAITDDLIQTKVKFETPSVILTAKLSDTGLVSSVPVNAIRGMANKSYNYSVVVNKNDFLQAINRILLFATNVTYGTFEFSNSTMTIFDSSKDNKETLSLNNNCENLTSYSLIVDLNNFKLILDGVEDEYITMNFGDKKAICVKKANITDIIPELRGA